MAPVSDFEADIRTVASRVVYQNPWLSVREDAIERADGSPGVYSVVDKGNYAVVVPYENDGFWLVEQYRYPVGERSWEFPMGTYPDRRMGDPLEPARRVSCLEETGLTAREWEPAGRRLLVVVPGFSSQGGHVYLAQRARARRSSTASRRSRTCATAGSAGPRAGADAARRDDQGHRAQTVACYGL